MALTKLTQSLIDGTLVTSVNGNTGAVTTGIDWQLAIKTSNFTAAAGKGYFVDTTSAAITATLPSSPTAGDELTIVDYAGTAATNDITITSSDNINSASHDVLINYERGGVSMIYVDAAQGWIAYSATNETANALNIKPVTVDYLVVAGGGGGGKGSGGGGGGAGGYLTNYGGISLSLTAAANYTVTVGAGGAGSANATSHPSPGANSVFNLITSNGGGYGASESTGNKNGGSGGSGGGGNFNSGSGGSGNTPSTTPSQGNSGGTGGAGNPDYAGGGGGGANASGSNAPGSGNGGNGGDGKSNSITGSSVSYAGGGGGGSQNSGSAGTPGTGGSGGGGNGLAYNSGGAAAVNNGDNNTGGGGGGGNTTGTSPSGGSGVVILRYPNTYTVTIGSGLTGSTATDGSDKITTFTAGTDTISFS